MSEQESSAVEKYFESLEGYQMPGFEHEQVFRCDFCSSVVHPTKEGHESPERRVTHYLTDRLLNEEYVSNIPAPFNVLRTYCPDCNRMKVQWPCVGFHELLVSSHFRPDGTIDDFKVEDFSAKDNGEPWDPAEVWEGVFGILTPGVTFDQYLKIQSGRDTMDRAMNNPDRHAMGFGPEDIVDSLNAWQIDIREVVDENGNVDIDNQKKAELKAHMEKRAEELDSTLGDESQWTDMMSRG